MKKIIATTTLAILLSSSAFAINLGDTTQGQLQGQIGINDNTNKAASVAGANVSSKINSAVEIKDLVELDIKDIDIDVKKEVNVVQPEQSTVVEHNYVEAKKVANTVTNNTPLSLNECGLSSGVGAQGRSAGFSGTVATEGENCVMGNLVKIFKDIDPKHKTLQMAATCTTKQGREANAYHYSIEKRKGNGKAFNYCGDEKTYLGVKPILQGVKEIILLPVTFTKWLINV